MVKNMEIPTRVFVLRSVSGGNGSYGFVVDYRDENGHEHEIDCVTGFSFCARADGSAALQLEIAGSGIELDGVEIPEHLTEKAE